MQKLNINNNSSNDTISEIKNNSSIGNNKDKHSNQYSRINYMILKCDTLVIYNSYQIKRVCVCVYKINYLCIYEWVLWSNKVQVNCPCAT